MFRNRSIRRSLFLLLLAVTVSRVTEAKPLLRREGSSNVNHNAGQEDQARALGRLSLNYIEPAWFESYKSIAGKALKRCKPQNNIAPANGSSCPKLKGLGAYSCAFGDQTCPDGSIHPKIKCNCNSGTNLWSCEDYKPCDVTPPVTTCPKQHPITFNPPLTCSEGLICPIGKQRCCGTTFPVYVCTCKGGVFDCNDDTSCSGKCGVTPVPLPVPSVAPVPLPTVAPVPLPSDAPVPLPLPTDAPVPLPTDAPVPLPSDAPVPLPTDAPVPSGASDPLFVPTDSPLANVSAPPNPRNFDCPNPDSDIPPERGSPCNLDASASCKYGKSCCCANCIDRFTATCKLDVWEVVQITFDCLPGPCPPTLPPGSLETAAPTGELSFTCPNPDSIIPPTEGSECSVSQAKLCKYDQICCCGSCVDRFYCTCVGGVWFCSELTFDCLACVDQVVTCPIPTDTLYPEGECTLPLDKVCGYGEVCCCDTCVVETSCQCNFGTWLCSTLDLLCEETCPPKTAGDIVDPIITIAPPIDPVTSCPIPLDQELSINGTMCELPDATECNYGKICCCESCIERFYCSCNGGEWICSELAFRCGPCDVATTECPIIDSPDVSPIPVGSCSVPPENECRYGKTCCCDNCVDEFYCLCNSGTWSCTQLAFSCLGPCPPPENGQPCKPDSVVESGEFECCGSISPQWVCTCGTAGTYECTSEFPPGVVCACAPPSDLLDVPLLAAENATIVVEDATIVVDNATSLP